MSLPTRKKNWIPSVVQRPCLALDSLMQVGLFRSFIRPIFFTFPVIIITQIGINWGPNVEEQIRTNISIFPIEFCKDNSIGIIVFVLIANYIFHYVSKFITYAAHSDIEKKLMEEHDLFEIYGYVDELNDQKNDRFLEAIKACKKKKFNTPIDIFQEFTKPDQQLYLIIGIIRKAFEQLDSLNSKIRVGLIEVKDSKPKDWLIYVPEMHIPLGNEKSYSNSICSISRSIKKSDTVVIDDLIKDFKKMRASEKLVAQFIKDGENGSVIAYPVVSKRKIIYVITLRSNKVNSFHSRYKKIYQEMLDIFAKRVILEHNLLSLKNSVEKCN